MARTINRLSARAVTTLTKPGLHADGAGLYLCVSPAGARRWTLIFRHRGKRCEFGIGPLASVSLATARDLAQNARELVAAGKNPIEERRRRKATTGLCTFGALADQFIADHSPSWKSAVHARQWTTTLETYAASLRALNVADITTQDVLGVLKPIWATKRETARRLRERIERILDAAKVSELREGENPARWKGHLALLLPKRARMSKGHHPALPFKRIGAFMEDLRRIDCLSARALEFTILTVVRTSEARLARVEEFDLKKATWVIPGERMKRGVPHRVPLSPRALEIVKERFADLQKGLVGHNGGPPLDGYVFPGTGKDGSLSNMAMFSLLPHMHHGKITVHGFRSTFRDWAGDSTLFPREFAEAALSHAVGDEVERAYRRGDALDIRRQLMEEWAKYCGLPSQDKIIQIIPNAAPKARPSASSGCSAPTRRAQQR